MRLRVFPSVEAPSQARRGLSPLSRRIDERSFADVRTLVSELVGMSVANGARRPIEISLELNDGRLEGVLSDDGAGARAIRRPDSSLVRRIVDALVEEWRASDEGKRIWFRMKVQPV